MLWPTRKVMEMTVWDVLLGRKWRKLSHEYSRIFFFTTTTLASSSSSSSQHWVLNPVSGHSPSVTVTAAVSGHPHPQTEVKMWQEEVANFITTFPKCFFFWAQRPQNVTCSSSSSSPLMPRLHGKRPMKVVQPHCDTSVNIFKLRHLS